MLTATYFRLHCIYSGLTAFVRAYRPPANLSQVHQRCETAGIMAKAGAEGKGREIFDLRFMICDWAEAGRGRAIADLGFRIAD